MAASGTNLEQTAIPPSSIGMPRALVKRVVTAAVAIPLFVLLVTWAPAWLFALFVVTVSALGVGELSRLFARSGQVTYGWLTIALAALLTASFAASPDRPGVVVPLLPVAVLSLAVAVLVSAPVWTRGRPSAEPVALGLLGLLYVSWFLGHGLLLHRLPAGTALVLVLVGVTWAGETAAYGVGSTLGRHRLAHRISPRKTVEGAAAQLIVSGVAALVLGPGWLLPDWTTARALGAGAVLGVVGQIGDLSESAIKRSVGVKDAGGLIPGHGGVLDRIDSLLFNTPAFFYYVRLSA